MSATRRVAKANLPTRHGTFEMFVYDAPQHKEHVALTLGAIDDGAPVLVRAHSECLTGDVFGSCRCDCGEQLADSLRFLQERGRGVLLYLRQEGRGIGLTGKISAYALQERGLDTVEANLALGLPEDMRDYRVAAEILLDLGVRRARLLTNNPAKIEGLERYGVEVVERIPLRISPNPSNLGYLRAKQEKMGHLFPEAVPLEATREWVGVKKMADGMYATEADLSSRPVVTLSYAQTLDGRLATFTGGSQWISAPESLRFSHELRAKHDAIMVGVGTACKDDPRLTVRLVAGTNPLRVVVDTTLRTPLNAAVLAEGAACGTVLAVTDRAPAAKCDKVRALGATVLRLPGDAQGRVDLVALLAALHKRGVGSVLVEGGARMITALLRARLVDRLAVCVAPKILGSGIEAVGDLGIRELTRVLIMTDTSVTPCGVDLILDSRVEYPDKPADGR